MKDKKDDETMVAEMLDAVQPKLTLWQVLLSIPQQIVDEWHGEGKLLGTGGFSEVVWGPVTFAIGLDLLFNSSSNSNTTIQLLMWYLTIYQLSFPLITSGFLTIVGIILFFIRGRCVASRVLRLIGAGLGIAIWFTLTLVDLLNFGMKHAFIYEHLGLFIIYARSAQLAWRKFLLLRIDGF